MNDREKIRYFSSSLSALAQIISTLVFMFDFSTLFLKFIKPVVFAITHIRETYGLEGTDDRLTAAMSIDW